MSGFGFSLDIVTGEFDRRMRELELPIAEAATQTMGLIADQVKREARSDIGRAGFSVRWQNTLRVDKYPKRGVSVDAAAFLYHRIPYAGVFEDGAAIRGKPLLWVRLPSTPPRIARERMTPGNLVRATGNRLVSMKSRSGTPLIGATIRLSRNQAAQDRPKVTLAALRRGKVGTGILRTVPLFAGIRVANIRKQLNIAQICARARDRIPALYAQLFREN